jgi:NAD(P)-dependent dehydrogenase (short-subunit alcohol dehydrogenase family)
MEGGSTRELFGKVAIVTGAARGLGRAMAELFAQSGASVMMTDTDAEEGENVRKAREKFVGKTDFMTADHGSEADWIAVVDRTLSRFGRVDIVVPNAGVHSAIPTADMPQEEFRRINRINLKGPFFGLKHGVAAMRKHGEGGSVILISSVAGKVGLPAHVHYCSSKGGVRLMAKAAALELGPEDIRVNSIHPGAIKTRMTAFADEETTARGIPLGRMGEPIDIAQAALFLASPRGRFITGAELVVDGGWIVP